jgi:hypothetical protein
MTAALRDWLRSMDLLGSAKTTSKDRALPPFGVELVHSEGVRSSSFAGHLWDADEEVLAVEADRRRRGLWVPPLDDDPVRFGRFAPPVLVDVPLPFPSSDP